MKTLELTQANSLLAGYVQHVGQEPFVLTMNGQPVAAVVSLTDIDWESISLVNNPQFREIIDEARARHQAEGGTSLTDIEREFKIGEDPLIAAYARVYRFLTRFNEQQIPGAVMNSDSNVILPRFEDLEFHYPTADSEAVDYILADSQKARWVVGVAIAADGLDKALDSVADAASEAQATPWLVVFVDVTKTMKEQAKKRSILLTDQYSWQDLETFVG